MGLAAVPPRPTPQPCPPTLPAAYALYLCRPARSAKPARLRSHALVLAASFSRRASSTSAGNSPSSLTCVGGSREGCVLPVILLLKPGGGLRGRLQTHANKPPFLLGMARWG